MFNCSNIKGILVERDKMSEVEAVAEMKDMVLRVELGEEPEEIIEEYCLGDNCLGEFMTMTCLGIIL